MNCSKLRQHWLTALLYPNPKENKNGFSSLTLLLLFSFVTKLGVFVSVPGQGLKALFFGRAHLSQVFSEIHTLQCVEHLPMAGAVHGVSLVINTDEFNVRRGGRQIPLQQPFFGQDQVLQQHTQLGNALSHLSPCPAGPGCLPFPISPEAAWGMQLSLSPWQVHTEAIPGVALHLGCFCSFKALSLHPVYDLFSPCNQ